ncbi:MAG: hypothetical protein ABEJ02_02335 [Candidatus Paceibacteria bacterium]
MKKILALVSILILTGGGYYFYLQYTGSGSIPLYTSPCKTLEYKVAKVDSEFPLGDKVFKNMVKKSENKWEEQINVDLFNYNPQAEFSINLVYDDNLTEFKGKALSPFEKQLKELKQKRDKFARKYDQASDDYNNMVDRYNRLSKEYNREIKKLEQQEDFDQEKYEQLQKKQERFESLDKKIEQKKKEAKQLAQKVKEIKGELELKTKNRDTGVNTFKNKFGQQEKFNRDNLKENKINIYSFRTPETLKLKLMHHMGHALGLKHADGNKSSVMYPKKSEQILTNLVLTKEDVNLLKESCNKGFHLGF